MDEISLAQMGYSFKQGDSDGNGINDVVMQPVHTSRESTTSEELLNSV